MWIIIHPEVRLCRTVVFVLVEYTGLASSDALPSTENTTLLEGKFRVPSLRNVAVTAPYMHNGVFKSLDTVIRFYDKHLTDSDNAINPET